MSNRGRSQWLDPCPTTLQCQTWPAGKKRSKLKVYWSWEHHRTNFVILQQATFDDQIFTYSHWLVGENSTSLTHRMGGQMFANSYGTAQSHALEEAEVHHSHNPLPQPGERRWHRTTESGSWRFHSADLLRWKTSVLWGLSRKNPSKMEQSKRLGHWNRRAGR